MADTGQDEARTEPPAGFLELDPQPIGERVGDVIGPYRLIARVGEGAFGAVFAAEQREPVRRMVALKVVKPGMETGAVLARFAAERQALALLDHPSVATVFDGGATPSGRPYFVMELVDGEPITQFCDRHRVTVRGRLELFKQVCAAVQHAHSRGVIHRDLKPDNVLVSMRDDAPSPKVIDFGVAKAMQPLGTGTIYTARGQLVGTPEYMSPEQADLRSTEIDARTDVYALGVLLYELLVGVLPFDARALRRAGLMEMLRVLREVEPLRPSARLRSIASMEQREAIAKNRRKTPAAMRQLVRGELDWITMRAMEKERTSRYESAQQLGDDVGRYLRDEVIVARPPTAGYRARKFAARNRGRVLLGGVAGLTIAVAFAFQQRAAHLEQENQLLEQRNDALEEENDRLRGRGTFSKDLIEPVH